MLCTVIGFEYSEGTSKKSGNPYSFGSLYVNLPMQGNKNGKGAQGSSFTIEREFYDKVKHLEPPFNAELTVEMVMKFGAPTAVVTNIQPVQRVAPVGKPAAVAA